MVLIGFFCWLFVRPFRLKWGKFLSRTIRLMLCLCHLTNGIGLMTMNEYESEFAGMNQN